MPGTSAPAGVSVALAERMRALRRARTISAKTDAVRALTTPSARGTTPALVAELAGVKNPGLRAALLEAIAVTMTADDLTLVEPLYRDATLGAARSSLADGLARLSAPGALRLLREALDDDELVVEALAAIADRGTRGATTRVRQLTRHDDAAVRAAAVSALERLVEAGAAAPAPDSAVERLRRPGSARRPVTTTARRPAPSPRPARPPAGPDAPSETKPQVKVETPAPVAAAEPPPAHLEPPPPVPPARTAADGAYLSIREGIWLWVRRSFTTPSRTAASLGTLTLTVALLALWSRSEPNWILAGVSVVLYAMSALLLMRARRRSTHRSDSPPYPAGNSPAGSGKITRPTYPG